MSVSALPGDPLLSLIDIAAADPTRLLLRTDDARSYTYGEFLQLVEDTARTLEDRGLARGERVVAQVEKSPEALALYLACLRLGAVFVPLNTSYTVAELVHFIEDADPHIAVLAASNAQPVRERFRHRSDIQFETLASDGRGTLLQERRASACPELGSIVCEASSLAALLYTSGTTGRSKGAMLTRGNLASNAATLVAAWRVTKDDVLLHALPIFHVHGLFVAVNTVLASGSSMLFMERFDPEAIIRALPRATVMMGVPTYYTRLLQHPALTQESCQNLRLFVSGSAPLLPDTHQQFLARTGHVILERYGMSETLMNTSNPYEGARVPGSVGLPLPDIEVRITEPGSGVALAVGRIGMIEVRGPNVCAGYWRMPEKTATEFRADGFFITGDLGRIDEQGYVYIVGRGKDLIISGGLNVYPIEVEAQIDALAEVAESAVIGVPHPDFGEAVTAVVVSRTRSTLNEAQVRAALESQLAKFKIPKRVVFVNELPRNAMGKVQKAELRARYRHLYE